MRNLTAIKTLMRRASVCLPLLAISPAFAQMAPTTVEKDTLTIAFTGDQFFDMNCS